METTKLKRFATEARINLMEGVMRRLRVLGFDDKGNVIGKEPELISGATLWRGDEYPEDFHAQWTELARQLRTRGVREVVEEAAYIWFNRLVAIRILAKNNLCEPILIQDETTGMPKLLADARMNMIPEMDAQHRRRFDKLMDDDTKTTEQFTALISAWCKENPIISSCFGSHNDYVELLLPDNITKPTGFLSLLNNTGFIADADYRSAELIGWLYQFYISDRKDEVFAKKGAYTADEIPAATQIFTPNWIVKYMVQNTILPQVDAPEELIAEAKYLVKNLDAEPCRKVELGDFKVADFACGSGHILNECFDLLFKLYREEGYSRREAIENIFTKNLTGIDIDLRAKQLATFALLLKACQRDESFADAHCLPHVLTVPDISDSVIGGNYPAYLQHFFLGSLTKEANEQLSEAFRLLEDAPTLGSIIKFDLSSSTRRQLVEAMQHWQSQSDIPYGIAVGMSAMEFILALTDSYDAIVMNPPYMPTSKEFVLKTYALKNYPDSKADLFAIFMDVCIDRLKEDGKYGMINMQSWMFLNSFEALRKKVISDQHIDSLLHLGPRTFDELSGEVVQNTAFVISKRQSNAEGQYFRLVDFKSCGLKEANFDNILNAIRCYPGEDFSEMLTNLSGYYYHIVPVNFNRIPGAPIAYWVSNNVIESFNTNSIGEFAWGSKGIITGDNSRFLRLWHEVNCHNIRFDAESYKDTYNSEIKWYPCTKGGSFRRWFGNNEYVIDWENNGYRVIDCAKSENRNCQDYQDSFKFKSSFSWADVCSNKPSFRYTVNSLSESKGMCLFPINGDIYAIGGFLNSSVANYLLLVLSPTLMVTAGAISKLPLLNVPFEVVEIVKRNISIAKEDWDAHETSWDFKTNELMKIDADEADKIIGNRPVKLAHDVAEELRHVERLSVRMELYMEKWWNNFKQLHANEEELNQRFIQIYDLEEELTPDVPFDEITILQQGEIRIEKNSNPDLVGRIHKAYRDEVSFNFDVIIKQFISYIVGIWMGRYRLDRPGLNIAHPNPTEDELAEYAAPYGKLKIDVDAIIPILPQDAPFFDNLYNYVRDFLRLAFGEESLIENLNFIEKCLGKRLDIYLQKDFWKDHKKMYQNKPIYWLFSSSKGAFQAIIYAHRMDRYTIEVMRSKYLLPYRSFVEKKIAALDTRAAELSTGERKELDRLRKDIVELDEYAQRVEVVAGESAQRDPVFDLDDGMARNHALFAPIATKLK